MKKLFISQPMSGKADEEISCRAKGGNQSSRRVVKRTCRGY